jgi:hypothetical protein
MARPRTVDSFADLLVIVGDWQETAGYVPLLGMPTDPQTLNTGTVKPGYWDAWRAWRAAHAVASRARVTAMRAHWEATGSAHFLEWAAANVSAEDWRRAKTRLRVAKLRRAGGNKPDDAERAARRLRARIATAERMARSCMAEQDPIYMMRRHIPLLQAHPSPDLVEYVRRVAEQLRHVDRLLGRGPG